MLTWCCNDVNEVWGEMAHEMKVVHGHIRNDWYLFCSSRTAVRFLMWTCRNVFCVRVGKRYIHLWRSQRSRTVIWEGLRRDKTEVERGLLALEPRPLPLLAVAPWTPLVRKPNPNLTQRPPRVLFCLKPGNSWRYARYSCGNHCNVVVKLVQECKFFMHFTSVLRKQFAVNDMFFKGSERLQASACIKKRTAGLCIHELMHVQIIFILRE